MNYLLAPILGSKINFVWMVKPMAVCKVLIDDAIDDAYHLRFPSRNIVISSMEASFNTRQPSAEDTSKISQNVQKCQNYGIMRLYLESP